MTDLLVRGGQLVDGTGGPGRAADVRVRDGAVAEIGAGLSSEGERVLDAAGAVVAPGFIENHTHYDASMFWDPTLEPMPQHGVTSVIIGNTSLSLVPMLARDRDDAIATFSFIEDIPDDAFRTGVPFDWETYGEYVQRVDQRHFSVNIAQLVGHSMLRMWVMGKESWKRAATDEERDQIVALLDDCLSAGAIGLSTSFFDTDAIGNWVPSRLADEAEHIALIANLASHGRILEFIADAHGKDPMADVERVGRWCNPYGVFSAFNGVINAVPQRALDDLDRCSALQAEGSKVYAEVSPRPQDNIINWDTSRTMMQMQATWGEATRARGDDKARMLMDPSWRAAARQDWDTNLPDYWPLKHPERMKLISVTRPENERWVGRTMAELAAERKGHISDVLADWVLENDMDPGIMVIGFANADPEKVAKLLNHPAGIIGNSDAGAHVRGHCCSGDTTLLLARFVRDRGDLTLERAVYELTGRQAEMFGFAGRGRVAVGQRADLTVFDLDELHWDDPILVHDFPGGSPRLTRPAGGYRYTVVDGVVTQEDGTLTANRPGHFLSA